MFLRIVFSDVDGTLLTSDHRMLAGTVYAIKKLQESRIPFVIISARSPSGIFPIMKQYGFSCPVICYSGALILDEDRKVLYSAGFDKGTARDVIAFIEDRDLDCCWNVFSMDTWIVKSRQDPRVILEERIVHAKAREEDIDSLPENAQIGKILCMCNPEHTADIEQMIRKQFRNLSIARSSDTLIEIMANGITKSIAVRELCALWDIPVEAAAAFGDQYNDLEMLETVGFPFLMGNAPEELKKVVSSMTDSNDNDGIYKGLAALGAIPADGRFSEKKREGEL